MMRNKKIKIMILVPKLENKGPIIVAKDIAENCKDKNLEFIFVSLRKNLDNNLENFKEYQIIELNLKKTIVRHVL